jgi:hypothetical protein
MPSSLFKILISALLLFLGATSTFSQSDNAQVSGTVSDPQGLAVAGAPVQVINQDTLTKRDTVTDETGHYAISFLPRAVTKL